MQKTKLALRILSDQLAICRLDPGQHIPAWLQTENNSFFSISRTPRELSIVCVQDQVPDNIRVEKNWKALEVKGPLSLTLTGVLSSILNPLAENKISIFAISTFDTDYILVKEQDLSKTVSILKRDFEFVDS